MRTLSGAELRVKVRELAVENPTKIAECLYVQTDPFGENPQPSCIVGQAIVELSESRDEAIQFLSGRNALSIVNLSYLDEFDIEVADLKWLDTVQFRQDERSRWADAVRDADRLAG